MRHEIDMNEVQIYANLSMHLLLLPIWIESFVLHLLGPLA